MPHGCHIYATSADMVMAKMCAYPPPHHKLPHRKCVLCCCSNFPHIEIPDQESDSHHYNAFTSIHFYIYHLIAKCKFHGRHPIDEKKSCPLCFQDPATVKPEKPNIRKELAMMESYIADLHTSFYIIAMQNTAFHLPHIQIIGTNHCGNTRREAFMSQYL